jgi:hypothetical protein
VLFKLFLQQTDKIPHLDLVRQELLTKRKETLVPWITVSHIKNAQNSVLTDREKTIMRHPHF